MSAFAQSQLRLQIPCDGGAEDDDIADLADGAGEFVPLLIPSSREAITREPLLKRDWTKADGSKSVTLLTKFSPREVKAKRAVHSAHVLRDFGCVFAENGKPKTEASAHALYDLSKAVGVVDQFISHSWSAGRFSKWVAMVDLYYRNRAVVLASSWWLLATCVGVAYRLRSKQPFCFLPAFILLTVIPALIVCGVTAFGDRLFPTRGSMVFLDRVCIHQWDDALKRQGVRCLGEVLRSSEQMMILWSADYFHRLWCIFEVATFNGYKDASQMILLPLWVAPFLYGMLLCNLCVLAVSALLQATEFVLLMDFWGVPLGGGMFWMMSNLVPALVICLMIRRSVSEKLEIESWVARFSLDESRVTVEEDRSFVYGQIQRIFGGLSIFEEFVQEDMLQHLRRLLGSSWNIPYAWGAFVFQPYLWYLSVDSLSMPDESIAAQVEPGATVPSWAWYAATQVQFYGMLFVLLPVAVKAVGCSAYLTLNWPLAAGASVDLLVFLLLVFVISTGSMICWDLLFIHQLVLEQPPLTF
mmetsp:Transcript_19062/g.44529  ORF Transcript_19062/g.44529 Transcript_19062/m.44529 type:complete len:527 (-) Transcript_19062:216-1796(-)